jgi:hypothetical protein
LLLSGVEHVFPLQVVVQEQLPQGASGEPQDVCPPVHVGGQQTFTLPRPNAAPLP